MKFNDSKVLLLLLTVIAIFFSSCVVDLNDVDKSITIDESLVVPIGSANLSVKEIIKRLDLPFSIDTTTRDVDFLWRYDTELDVNRFNIADSVKAYDKKVKFGDYIPYMLNVKIPANTYIIVPVDDYFDMGFNSGSSSLRVDSVKVNSTDFNVSIDVSGDLKKIPASDFAIQYVFPSKNIVSQDPLPIYYPKAYNENATLPVGQYSMYLNGASKIPYTTYVHLKTNNIITLTDTSWIKIRVKFANVDSKVAYGLFNYKFESKHDIEIPFDLKSVLPDSSIMFADPRIKVAVATNAGMNFITKINSVAAYNDVNQEYAYAWFDNHTTKTRTEEIVGPSVFGNWKSTTFKTIDAADGETDKFFAMNPYPNRVTYDVSINEDQSRKLNFVSPDSRMKVTADLEVPLYIKSGFAQKFTDTLNIGDIHELIRDVDTAVLVLKIKNGFPLQAKYHMTLLNSTTTHNDTIPAVGGVINDIKVNSDNGTLTDNYWLSMPTVDSSGIVTNVDQQVVKIILTPEEVEYLRKITYVKFTVYVANKDKSGDTQPAHVTSNCTFDLKVGIYAKGRLIKEL